MRVSLTIVFTSTLILCLHLARSEDHHKRVPSGFTGVRGKKSITENSKTSPFYEDDADDESGGNGGSPQVPIPATGPHFASGIDGELMKRAPSMGFVGMRGKKPWDERDVFDEFDYDSLSKRAPNGFFGMRGKKGDELDSLLYDLEKRMNSGFFGMRGKKEFDFFDTPAYMSEKRAPSMGFVGMRGRKNYDDSLTDFGKRAPSGFFGMRGKKQWPLFALRGKKIPYQFRSKFVGVRGKKSMFNDDSIFEKESNHDLNMDQLMQRLTKGDMGDTVEKTGADDV
ncbi:hypothetical protein HHI36_014125 [Cryptolaemus montrouzieri]|uniref:Uncharacterized protein n=1 Tax=Cryptolaemus montrouzieri TaxID=559131 RepID=A0ABD2N2L6_9CUCU